MNEKRIASRHRVLKAGKLSLDGGAIDCTVRNISKTGAALEVATPIGIPHAFIPVIEADHVRQTCRVVWRMEKRIGVAFDQN